MDSVAQYNVIAGLPNGAIGLDGQQTSAADTKIVRARLDITGTKAFLWNWFGPDAIPLEEGEKTGRAGNDPEEWRSTYLATPSGQLFFLDSYMFTTLRNGAAFVKAGRSNLVKALSSTLEVEEEQILLDRWMPKEDLALPQFRNAFHLPVYLDVRSSVNPSTKKRNIRYRVASAPGWKATCTVRWDKTIVNRANMEEIAHKAGKLIGLGDGRAIGKGRFKVMFTVLADDDA